MTLEEALDQCRPTNRGSQSAEAETSRGVYTADRRHETLLYSFDDGTSVIYVDPHWVPQNLSWKPMRPKENGE